MKSAIAVLLAAGVALVAPAPARSGDEPTRPQPACKAAVMQDERGDAENPGLDMVGVFLTESLGNSFANVVVADLDDEVDQPGSTQEFFTLYYRDDAGETERREARIYRDGSREGATFFDGAEGIVQFRLPSLTPGTPTTMTIQTGGENELIRRQIGLYEVRVKPSTEEDTLETGGQPGNCPAPKPVTTAPETPAPDPAAPADARPAVTAGTLRLRGRTLRVPLRSTGRVSNLRGRLTRNGRLVARGRLAELDGRGVLVLTARRAFRPGIYWLSIPGVIERRVRIA